MNNKIAFPELVEKIAELTNTSKRVSELFLKELFGVIKERLEQGETVKIKNLGTFKVTEVASRKSVNVNTGVEMEIASHRRVTFTPDKSLAEAVNAPFEEFETIMLDDDVTEDKLEIEDESVVWNKEYVAPDGEEINPPVFVKKEDGTDEETEVQNAECVAPDREEINPPVFVEKEDGTDEETEVRDEECVVPDKEEVLSSVFVEKEDEKNDELEMKDEDPEVISEDFDNVRDEKRKSFVWGFLGGIVTFIVIGCIAIAICDSCFGDFIPYIAENEKAEGVAVVNNAIDTVNVKPDTMEQKNIEPVKDIPKIITDTVRVNYYLTKMSRKYYGRYEFWVYIYEENKDKIKNPNKVAPGLVVVIPPAEKYGIDKNSEESVSKANKLAENIR